MACKIFYGRSRKELEAAVNNWLKSHPVSPESMRFQFSTVSLEDSDSFVLEHTLVVFYIPMMQIH